MFLQGIKLQQERLMIGFKNVKNAYLSKEIDDIIFMRPNFNIADALMNTKNQEFLIKILTSKIFEHPIDQWIVWEVILILRKEEYWC